jgi:hypothetical protein
MAASASAAFARPMTDRHSEAATAVVRTRAPSILLIAVVTGCDGFIQRKSGLLKK